MDMGLCDGAVFLQQELRHWFADQIGAPDNKGMKPGHILSYGFNKSNAALRRTGQKTGQAKRAPADIDKVQSIDIAAVVNFIQQPQGIKMFWYWQLQQDAVGFFLIQPADKLKNFSLGYIFGKAVNPA